MKRATSTQGDALIFILDRQTSTTTTTYCRQTKGTETKMPMLIHQQTFPRSIDTRPSSTMSRFCHTKLRNMRPLRRKHVSKWLLQEIFTSKMQIRNGPQQENCRGVSNRPTLSLRVSHCGMNLQHNSASANSRARSHRWWYSFF